MRPAVLPFHLVLIFHAHQPSGNFEHVFEECYKNSYHAFLQLLEKHPAVRVGLHYSGSLLLWLEQHHPEYFGRLKNLVAAGQVELIGGGFYEPILISIPPQDQLEQLRRLSDYLEERFGNRPSGAWLAERVWEPQLPSVLAEAGVRYTLVDDLAFLSAGFEPEELFGTYIAEDQGKVVQLFSGLKELRYLIPFRKVDETIAYLKAASKSHPGGMAAFGDDMEKFGVWPGTFEHCYTGGWLEEFLSALEENSGWLKISTPSQFIASHAPLGRADLPSSSYAEMMEWVLPTPTRRRYFEIREEFRSNPRLLNFLRGGSWRGFLRKYPEANLLHKKMLRASASVAAIPARHGKPEHHAQAQGARDLSLRGQGNDAYWHGVFGGIYAPHLRTEIWRNLIRAESIADQLMPGNNLPRVEQLDYEADGETEFLFTASEYQALLKPGDGGTLALFDFRTARATIINSILRRPESYHTRLREAATLAPTFESKSIHEQIRVKEPNLERFLRYDRYPRHSFRALLFEASGSHAAYEALQLNESVSVAAGNFQVQSASENHATLCSNWELPEFAADAGNAPSVRIEKQFLFGPAPQGCEASCEIKLTIAGECKQPLALGLESIVNFLAPTEPDRFFETPFGPRNLRFSGVLLGPLLRVEDGWQKIRMTLHAPNCEEFWIAPIETVSESEGGFERVYQGSQILAVWRLDLRAQTTFTARLLWRLEAL